jgi:uncharacterized protein YfaS (alpha-2-macroglobulin family)
MMALLTLATALHAAPRDAQWKEVEEARHEGLPKTAIEKLGAIIQGALADRADAEAIRAISLRIALEAEIQGDKPEEKVMRMQAELEKAPAQMRPVLEAILAHWYWQYFRQHRWELMQRTRTVDDSGNDLRAWDLGRVLAEIDRRFAAALANEKVLKATPVREYDQLLRPGSVPDAYRPTLFDFLAYEALQFYQVGEQDSVKDEASFELEADSPIFDGAAEFARWRPATADQASPALKAIRLYRALLEFHQGDTDRSAYYDADLSRITYGHNAAVGEDKDDRYKTALRRFIEATAKHEISARAIAELARQIDAEGEPAEAHGLAQRGLQAFPDSAGGAMCYNLILKIEEKSAQVTTESVWNAPWPTIDVEYRNVTRVYFRAIRADFKDHIVQVGWPLSSVGWRERASLLASPPALQWSAELPPTKDFKQRTERLPAPTTLKPGYYFILASHDPTFASADHPVSAAAVWVSDLALVLRARTDGAAPSGLVLRSKSGEPVARATVHIWQQANAGRFQEVETTATDEDGRFEFSARDRWVFVLADADGQEISSSQGTYNFGSAGDTRSGSRTMFFTDREIYRPGQAIRYKGITIRYNQDAGEYAAVADLALTVVFNDPNGKEIARAVHQTNDYGSFSGEFTAPRDRMTGRMTIQVLGSESSTAVSVEEYKRPKFRVEVDPPGTAPRLGAPVVLTGKASAYTGSAVGGAKVRWRVERGVQLPYWCWWWRAPANKAIAHGNAVTEQDGTFKVQFSADPDQAVPAKNEPTFSFILHADVTDTTGETRSVERTVRAGYAALQALLAAEEWQTPDKPVMFTVATRSLDGDPQPAQGVVTVQALIQPAKVERAALQPGRSWFNVGADEPRADPTNPDSWVLGPVVDRQEFKTDSSGKAQASVQLKAGIYRASLETTDRFGGRVTARQTVQVVDPADRRCRLRIPNFVRSPKWEAEPGDTFAALWGTGYDTGRAFVELECDGKPLKRYWTASDRTQESIALPITEEMRGGVTMQVTYIRESRAYISQGTISVPWSNKKLSVKWEHFRSKLTPGQKERWTAIVTDPGAKRCAAEMVATLYDASLDQFEPHDWPREFGVFRQETGRTLTQYQNIIVHLQGIVDQIGPLYRVLDWSYRALPSEILSGGDDGTTVLSPFVVAGESANAYRASTTLAGTRVRAGSNDVASAVTVVTAQFLQDTGAANNGSTQADAPDLSKVTARRNLSETAFFYPQLVAGDDGIVKIEFTVPEALTEWRFLAFAHDKNLRAGFLTDQAVTAKDLMVEPNPPRFVREGDTIEFTVKVSNQAARPQVGRVNLAFADAATLLSMDGALGNQAAERDFDVPAGQSRSYSWRITVPDGMGFLTYKAVGASSLASDGEEGFLPVLSRQVLVTESLPLPMRGKSAKTFEFKKLLESGDSRTLRSQSLTVQMVSQPAWYAVMSLPYLMEYPYECSEQLFNRLYANALARHIANSDPKIRRVFDLWKETPALESPLSRNQELQSVMLEETPWVRQAGKESQSRRDLGLLFDDNRLDEESARALRQLSERQLPGGLWSWFPGGRPSEFISLYIATGFARLRRLGAVVDMAPALRSLEALDEWMDERYRQIARMQHPEDYVPTSMDAYYLYGRSFFLKDKPIASGRRDAVDFFLRQSRKFWLRVGSRQSQAHLAIALQRLGDRETPPAIMKSIKEHSISDEELGMYWRDEELGWWWYRAPIETQAVMIEAFDEVSGDAPAVEACKIWLLKQKQTQAWETTKATADAIYSLLLRGDNLLASDALVEVALAGEAIKPEKVEAGTGFFEQKFLRGEIKPAMGLITVKKVDDGIGWGSAHWQYLEDVGKVTPHEGTPLKLTKKLFVKETTTKGQVLVPVTGPLSIGDELVVRIELRADRDMEYIHLKDQRASGTEPVDVLSGYKFQAGLAYYESTRDTATHFFIDYLPKGVYVLEYSTRVQLKGSYQTGIAEIQSMYAPEFNSHSESFALEIK